MPDNIVSTRLSVSGIRNDDDVRRALQALFDIFADQGLGQATFEIGEDNSALWIKHKSSVTPDRDAIGRALSAAGDYRVVA